jgi:DNA polymerase III delta subunit
MIIIIIIIGCNSRALHEKDTSPAAQVKNFGIWKVVLKFLSKIYQRW